MSEKSFHWCSCLGAVAVSEGLRAYSGGEAGGRGRENDYGELRGGEQLASAQRALTKASYSCIYPADRLNNAEIGAFYDKAESKAWRERRQTTWTEALVSLYGLLRVRQCYAFYIIYQERTILFCAPGVGGVEDGGYAVVTECPGRMRTALSESGVHFVSADEEAAAIDIAKKAKKQLWRAEDELKNDIDDSKSFLDSVAGDEVSRAADRRAVENNEEATKLANMDRPSAARLIAAGTIICRGAIAVSGLLNLLIESGGADPGSASYDVMDVPTLLAPVPFAHSCMKPLALHVQMNTAFRSEKDIAGSKPFGAQPAKERVVYTAETERNEFVPPWTLARVCAVLAATQGDIRVMCSTVPQTHGLNVGVIAARDFSERNITRREKLLVRECAYYDEAETSRIMAPPPLGSSVVSKIEYVNGKYYV